MIKRILYKLCFGVGSRIKAVTPLLTIQVLALGLLVLAVPVSGHAQEVKKAQKGTFILTNAVIETITQGTQKGNLLIRDGKIAALGDVSVPADAQVIDCTGLTLYPGMIDAGTTLGLGEISSISLTQDSRELGDIKPHMKALTAVNPNAVAIPVTRVDGVTTVLTKPQGGRVSGQAALINLVGYTPDQMYAGFSGMVINFPSSSRRSSFDTRTDDDLKKEKEQSLKSMNDLWEQAAFYASLDSAAATDPAAKPEYSPDLEAMLPVVRGQMSVLLEVNRADDIKEAIKWVTEKKLKKVIFTGVAEGWRVADELAAAKIPVITGPIIAIPTRQSDRYDRAYANAGLMHKAGVTVAIRSNSEENVRNLPFHAGFAAAYGMGKEAAMKAITIVPAQLFGVEKQLGSLEIGKSATLYASTGDPFEHKTQIKHLFIEGYLVPLDSRHIRLYEEFLDRSPGVKK